MARVKSFQIDPSNGSKVPDEDIKNFINWSEKHAIVQVSMLYIPAMDRGINPRILVVTTKLDDLPLELSIKDKKVIEQ